MRVYKDQAEAANISAGVCKNACYVVAYFPPKINRPGQNSAIPGLSSGWVTRGMTTRHGI